MTGRGGGAAWLGRRAGARVSVDPIRTCVLSAAGRMVMRGKPVFFLVVSGRGCRTDSVDGIRVCAGLSVGGRGGGHIDILGKFVLPGRGSVEFARR